MGHGQDVNLEPCRNSLIEHPAESNTTLDIMSEAAKLSNDLGPLPSDSAGGIGKYGMEEVLGEKAVGGGGSVEEEPKSFDKSTFAVGPGKDRRWKPRGAHRISAAMLWAIRSAV